MKQLNVLFLGLAVSVVAGCSGAEGSDERISSQASEAQTVVGGATLAGAEGYYIATSSTEVSLVNEKQTQCAAPLTPAQKSCPIVNINTKALQMNDPYHTIDALIRSGKAIVKGRPIMEDDVDGPINVGKDPVTVKLVPTLVVEKVWIGATGVTPTLTGFYLANHLVRSQTACKTACPKYESERLNSGTRESILDLKYAKEVSEVQRSLAEEAAKVGAPGVIVAAIPFKFQGEASSLSAAEFYLPLGK